MDFAKVSSNLKERGFQVHIFANASEAASCLLESIKQTTVGIGGSATVEALNVYDKLAAPKRAQQMNHKTPYAMKAGKCYDCKSPECICRGMVTLWGPMAGTQVEVLLVDEDLGL